MDINAVGEQGRNENDIFGLRTVQINKILLYSFFRIIEKSEELVKKLLTKSMTLKTKDS